MLNVSKRRNYLLTSVAKLDFRKFHFRILTDEDVQESSKLLSKMFHAGEPVVQHLAQNIGYSFNPEKYVSKGSKQQLSIVCEDVSQPICERILGVQVCSALELSSSIDKHDYLALTVNHMMLEWIRLHPELKFEELSEKVFHLDFVATKAGFENYGIATKLIMESLNHAKQKGFQIAMLEASGYKTQKIFGEKLKFKEMNSIVYDEFEIDGRRVFKGLKSPPKLIVYEMYLDSI
ncbi:hypothetical protein B4U79_17513 [Dinothrombium tinctorium]|uniref:N-acetyltransferase domain-containing protein n=1 Tax=Dinothrombium tinctorium TaxID=1965070 RepID=A0A443R8I8_9ACAR|nr:hypothetical protein B4U79_17513 [Dinothrombium tinctorium]